MPGFSASTSSSTWPRTCPRRPTIVSSHHQNRTLRERGGGTDIFDDPAALLNALPCLDRWLPGRLAPWRVNLRRTTEAKEALKDLYQEGLDNAQRTGVDNWASLTRAMPEFKEVEATSSKLAYITIDLFGAGSESVFISFFPWTLVNFSKWLTHVGLTLSTTVRSRPSPFLLIEAVLKGSQEVPLCLLAARCSLFGICPWPCCFTQTASRLLELSWTPSWATIVVPELPICTLCHKSSLFFEVRGPSHSLDPFRMNTRALSRPTVFQN